MTVTVMSLPSCRGRSVRHRRQIAVVELDRELKRTLAELRVVLQRIRQDDAFRAEGVPGV